MLSFVIFIFYIVFQIHCIATFDGKWKIAAIFPLPIFLLAIISFLYAINEGNDLYLIIAFLLPVILFVYLVIVALARCLLRKN
jgi:hypothetical protein